MQAVMHAVHFDISAAETMIAEMSVSGAAACMIDDEDVSEANVNTRAGTYTRFGTSTSTRANADTYLSNRKHSHHVHGKGLVAEGEEVVDMSELGDLYGMIRQSSNKKTREWLKMLRRSAAAFSAGHTHEGKMVVP
jgi:hypothetical protein